MKKIKISPLAAMALNHLIFNFNMFLFDYSRASDFQKKTFIFLRGIYLKIVEARNKTFDHIEITDLEIQVLEGVFKTTKDYLNTFDNDYIKMIIEQYKNKDYVQE